MYLLSCCSYISVLNYALGITPVTSMLHFPDSVSLNVSLIRQGYLGASPTSPACAFSLQLLHLYRQLHRACPRFSISAFCKALHFFHRVSYLFNGSNMEQALILSYFLRFLPFNTLRSNSEVLTIHTVKSFDPLMTTCKWLSAVLRRSNSVVRRALPVSIV